MKRLFMIFTLFAIVGMNSVQGQEKMAMNYEINSNETKIVQLSFSKDRILLQKIGANLPKSNFIGKILIAYKTKNMYLIHAYNQEKKFFELEIGLKDLKINEKKEISGMAYIKEYNRTHVKK